MDIFNTRELAAGTWLVIFLTFAVCSSSDVRVSVRQFLNAIINKTILSNLLVFISNTALLVYLLDLLGYWSDGQYKNLGLWFFASGIVIWSGVNKFTKDGKCLITVVKNQINVMLFVEFLVAFKTYSYFTELFLLLLPVLFSLVKNATNLREFHVKVYRQILAFGYGFILYDSVQTIYLNGSSFWTYSMLQDFMTPVLLTILSLPYFVVFSVYLRLERSMCKINIYTKDQRLRWYARYLAIKEFGLDYESIKAWLTYSCVLEFESRNTILIGLKNYKSSDRYRYEK
ncbi:membrane hypothetical protein [Vibrio nigripulchritudo MADA3029]|uniref:hypothetical protein n=1 Tax=Vibrio nigripulchritudo TaxID=28173 RepID=UPI0003B202C5|nr:hypothetical protein [Vibrio nigripulchritudo]CCN49231.1 membrane hypothetical protein [Vibrio nigripulchritudo MADA3020]CCN54215.1 membrane hypothetical protein [Vibrio nigripulchritudo MADA3021]CCN61286.1 membrane hypothetical protein [Vibrio nigripulchritudo MADA3029]